MLKNANANPSKTKGRKAKLMVDPHPEEFNGFSKAGVIPPTDESSDDGRVEREVDVMSEPPDIDTTRAEEQPNHMRKLCFLCGMFSMLALGGIMMVTTLVLVTSHSACSVQDVLASMATLNTSNIDIDVIIKLYDACRT